MQNTYTLSSNKSYTIEAQYMLCQHWIKNTVAPEYSNTPSQLFHVAIMLVMPFAVINT